ncbi:Calx-beta domain-containing protein [Rubripirellula reticaptiva]|uniref:Calx-beta domain-containing protein n=1 Tax=Rubripirellula reticaptiva TaxID=2528013 RepID=UPI0011B5972F|nr:Calx-beta domain-containing protein [Rubripirellula reticaptiva]
MTSRFVSAAFRSANMGSSRREKIRQRSMQWAAKLEARRVRWVEQREARIKRYRKALRGAWLTRVGLGLAAIISFILNPPVTIVRRQQPIAPFMMGLPFMFKKKDKNKKRRDSSKRSSTTRSRLNPETLEQRMLLAANLIGSYDVGDGPHWTTNPAVYSAREAAVLNFGGDISDYLISVNNTGFPTQTGLYDGWGEPTLPPFGQDYKLDTGAPGYDDPSGGPARSAWVRDHIDVTKTNYVYALSGDLDAQLNSGNLVISDLSANSDNEFLISQSGGEVTVQHVTNVTGAEFKSVPLGWTLSSDGRAISGPTPATITVNGGPGSDLLTVDVTGGIGVPVTFNGGSGGAGENDELEIIGGSSSLQTINHTGPQSGNVVFDGGAGVGNGETISFTGLEPVLIAAGTPTDVIFNLPATGDDVLLTTSGANLLLDSLNGTFEDTTFAAPSGSMTVNLSDGADDIEVVDLTANFTGDLFINGGNQTDSYTLAGGTITGLNSATSGVANLTGEALSGYGTVAAAMTATGAAIIHADTAGQTLAIGDVSAILGYSGTGANVTVDAGATLELSDLNGSQLGPMTTVDGTLTAIGALTTVNLLGPDVLTGDGIVDATVVIEDGTLKGNLAIIGEVDGVNFSQNGLVSPGASIGTLTMGSLTLNSGDTLAIEIDGSLGAGNPGGHDQVVISGGTGGVNITGATLSLSSLGGLSATGVYTIIDNDGTDPVVGTFAGLPEGSQITLGGRDLILTYIGGTGQNDVMLFTAGLVEVEFELASSSDGETSSPTNTRPTVLVRGDLTGIPARYRGLDFSLTAGSATAGAANDFTLDLDPTNPDFVIPEGNYSATVGEFDLTKVDSLGRVSGDAGFTSPVLEIFQDNLIEGDEGLSFNFTNGLGDALRVANINGDSGQRSGTTHIIQDDDRIRISIVANPDSVEEGNPVTGDIIVETSTDGGVTFDNTAVLTPNTSIEFTIQDATGSSTAVTPADYSFVDDTILLDDSHDFVADGALVLPFDLTTEDDSLVEGPETVDLEIVNVRSQVDPGALSPTGRLNSQVDTLNDTVTITDNDLATWSITGSTNVTEGADATYTISLTGSGSGTGPFILQNMETATIDLAQTNGPADATTAADYDNFLTELGLIVAGRADLTLVGNTLTYTGDGTTAMADIVVAITATEDFLVEGPENYTVTLSTPGTTTGADIQLDAGNASVQTAIADNDLATWSIVGDANVAEGADASYTISLTGSTTGAGAGPFVLQAGETASIVISQTDGPADPTTAADYDSFLTAVGVIAAGRADLTLVGNVLTYTGDGATAMADIVVNDLTATEDFLVEGPENFTVTLATPGTTTNADIQLDAGNSSVQTQIADNDLATWSIVGDANVAEGADASYTISLTGSTTGAGAGPFVLQAGETASIVVAQTDGPADATTSADYDSFLAELGLIAASRADLDLTGSVLTYTGDGTTAMADIVVAITATEDFLVEGPENYTVTLATPGTTTNANIQLAAGIASVQTAIADNDLATWSIVGDANVAEGADASYTISLTGSTTGAGAGPFVLQAGETASIVVAQTDGPADPTTSADYDSFLTELGIIAAGRADLTLVGNVLTYTGDGATAMTNIVVAITATEDSLVEGPENFTVTLATPGTTTNADIQLDAGSASVQTAIADNDFATWSISSNLPSVVEGNDVTYTVDLDGDGFGTGPFILQAGETATIDLAQVDGPAPTDTNSSDYDSFLAAVGVVAAGRADLDLTGNKLTYTGDGVTAMADIVVMLTAIDDTLVEGSENFTLVIDNAGSTTSADIRVDEDAVASGQDSVQTEIIDNDSVNWTLVETSSGFIDEGDAATYVLTLDGTGGAMPLGNAALQAGDTATIQIGMALLAPISLNDFDEESDQSLNELNPLGMAVQDAVDAYNTAAGTTTGDDNSFGFSAGKVTYYGDSTTTAPALTIELNTFEDDGFEQGAGPLKHLSNYVEPDETFEIMISNPGGSVGGPPQVTANGPNTVQTTIVDDNTTEITIMKLMDAQEGNDGALTNEAIINGLFEVKLSNPSQNIISVTLTDGVGNPLNDNGTASNSGIGIGNLDYQNSSLNVVNFSAGDQSEIASVDVIDDMVIEGTENVVATLTGFTVAPHIPSGATLNSGDVTIGVADSASLDIIDDDAAVLTVGDVTVNEADGTATITVTLDKAVQNGFTVPYTLGMVGDTATGGSGLPDDYNNTGGVLTFNGTIGEVVNITIPIFNDDVVEDDESFTVKLGTIVPGTNNNVMPPVATVNPSQVDVSDIGTVTILNDDIDLTLSAIVPATQAEGNPGDTTTYTFTVTRTGLTTGTTTVNYAVTGSGATAADVVDFDGGLASGTLTFAPTETVKTVTIEIEEDLIVEADEEFTVTLSGQSDSTPADSVDVVDSPQTAIIENDDSAFFSIADISVNEAAGTATVTVKLNGAVQGGVSVNYLTADGTATLADNDYNAAAGTLTFAGTDGEEETFVITINNDDKVENDETINVSLDTVAPTNINIDANDIDASATATVTIVNDDIDLTLSPITPATQAEGNPGDTTSYTFTVTRTGLLTGTTTVNYAVVGSGAAPADGADFDGGLPAGTLTFAATETVKTVTIEIAEDLIVEADEQFTVQLSGQVDSNPADSVDLVGNDQTAIIENDDTATFTVEDVSVNEVDGTVTLTVLLTGGVQGGVTVDYTTIDGSATDPNDYAATTGTLTFAGTDGETQTFTVTIANDGVVEPTENFLVQLSNGDATDVSIDDNDVVATDDATVTILDDDIDITLGSASPASQDEGNPGDATVFTFVVTRNGLSDGETTVDYNVVAAAGSAVTAADFAGGVFPSGVVTFAVGETSKTITVELEEELIVEPDESFEVVLSNANHTPGVSTVPADIINLLGNNQAATIVNDDMAILTTSDVTVYEDSVNHTITVTVTLDVDVQGGFTVDWSTEDITALVANNDYIPDSGTLTFTGVAGESQTLTVTIVGDDVVEPDEQLRIVLSNVVPTDPNVDPADVKINGTGIPLNSQLTLTIDGSTFNETPPPMPTGGPVDITLTTNDADQLVAGLLGSGITAVPGSAVYVGGANSSGFFTGGGSSIQIETGIVLTTGSDAIEAEPGGTSSGESSQLGDADLDAEFGLTGDTTEDVTYLEFDFISQGGDLFFDFVFASDEYSDFVFSSFNDVFAFFLDGQNIALIPGTTTPVSIDTVNNGPNNTGVGAVNSQFFNDNEDPGSQFLTEFGFDGFTDVFTAQALNLTPGAHTIKLAIADVGDTAVSSAVFFRANSFSGTPNDAFTATNTSSNPATQINQIQIDLSTANLQFDTGGTSAGQAFTPTVGSDVDTGLTPVTLADGSSLLTMDFSDFMQGESLTWQVDVDSLGLDDVVTGDQIAGATVTVSFNDGTTATGILTAVPGNSDAARVILTTTPPTGPMGLITILNDDIDLDLKPSPETPQVEGNTGTTNYTFEVTRAGFITGSTEDTTVDWAVTGSGPNPASPLDFVGNAFPSGTVTFGPGETTKTITVAVQGDNIAEVNESFTVTLSNAQNADPNLDTLDIITTAQSAEIVNDDTANVSVVDDNGAANPGDVTVQEPDTGDPNVLATFTIALDKPADQAITIDITTSDGTATTANNDYVTTTQTVTIAAGDLTTTFSVPVVGDNAVELDENFFITLSEPTYNGNAGTPNPLTGGPGTDLGIPVPQVAIVDAVGEGIINNEDALIEFLQGSSIKNEAGVVPIVGENGPTLIVRGDLTGTSIADRTITLQRLGGTADPGNDYLFGSDPAQLLPAMFVVPEGDYSAGNPLGMFDLTLWDENGVLASVSGNDPVLNVKDDSLIEGNESLTVELQGLGVALQQGNADQGLGLSGSTTIHDDTTHIIGDDDFATFTIVPGQSVEEELGTQPVTVELTTTGTTAAPAAFAPGVTITLNAVDNLGGTATTPADYAFTPQSLTFTSADLNGATRTIDLTPASDLLVEGPETVDLGLNFTSASPFVIGGQVVLVNNTVQINDDDSALIGLTVASTTVDEAAGTVTLNVQVDKAVPGGFVVDYSLTDGTATNGVANDYGTGAVTGSIPFTGIAGEIVPIVVAINEDLIVEGLEDFTLTLTGVTNNTAPVSFSSIDPSNNDATVSITDNDGTATVSASVTSVNEGAGTATVTLTLDKDYQGGLTVDYSTADNTADGSDYTITAGTATFPLGMAGETVTFTVPITEDSVVEGTESLNIVLSNPLPIATPAGPIATTDGSVSITDNDGTATVSADVTTVNEGDGTATVTLTLDKDYQGGLTVDYTTADNTADGSDYSATTGTATFIAGTAGETVTFTVPITEDLIVEGTESLNIVLSNPLPIATPAGPIATADGSVSITDNDGSATVSASVTTVNEGDGTATVTLTLDKDFQGGLTVDYTTADNTASGSDYSTTTGTATFTAGTAGETVTFTVPITEDLVLEGTELLDIQLSNPLALGSPAGAISTVDGSVSITDNDASATVSVVSQVVNENAGTVTVTVQLDKAVQGGFTVDVATADGTAIAPGDYTAVPTTTLNFAGNAGETQTFTVDIIDDMIIEPSETLDIVLSNVVPGGLVNATDIVTVNGDIEISVDDTAEVSLIPVVTTTTEGGPIDKAEYTLALSPGTTSSTPTTVDFNTGGTARRIAGPNAHQVVDYTIWADDGAGNFTEVTGTQLTIPAGVNSIAIELRVVDDVVVEVQETVDLQLTGTTGGAVAAGDPGITLGSPLGGVSTIDDNDSAMLIIKSIDGVDDVASETGIGDPIDKATFRVRSVVPGSVTPTNPLGTPAPIAFNVSVGYDISSDSALNTLDYTAIAGSVFFAPGVTEVPIDILPFDDSESEGPETVTLTLDDTSESTTLVGAPIHLVQVDPGNCDTDTITILDNDFGDIVVEVGNVTANEGDGTVFVSVTLQTSIPVTSSAIPVTLNFTPLGATPGVDFTVASPTVTFNPGDLAGTVLQVAIDIVDDPMLESIEAFGITMTSTYVPGVGEPALDLTDVGAGVIIDNDAMQVTDVKVSSTNWLDDFKDLADGEALGSGSGVGYSIPTGTGTQVNPLPWVEINQLIVTFSKDIDPASVIPGTNVVLQGFDTTPTYNVTVMGNQLLIEITTPGATTPALAKDNYSIKILDTVLSVGGAPLDGDFTNGSDALPSGGAVATGSPGNQLSFHFVVNPGDATQNGITDTADIASLFGQFFQGPAGNYSIFTDFTGNAFIDTSDLSVAFGNFFGSPPVTFPLIEASSDEDILEDSTVESMALAMIDSVQDDEDDDDSNIFDEALLDVLGDLL